MNAETQTPASTEGARALVAMAPPEVVRATAAANALYTQASAIVVDSPELYQLAADELGDLRARWKAIEAQRVHLKAPFLEGCQRIDEFFRAPLKRLEDAAELVKGVMLTYKTEEDRKAEELRRAEEDRQRLEREELQRQQREAEERQRLAQEEADRKAREAREESERIAREAQERADAERQRLEDEARAAAEAGDTAGAEAAEAAAREAQETADREAAEARAQAERDAQAAQEKAAAETLAAQQQADEAQAAIELAEVAPALPVATSAAVASGVSSRKAWKVKAVDKRALVIAAGKAAEAGDDTLLAFLEVDEPALNKLASAMKAATRVAGVVFGEVTSLATNGRGRR